jgi:hypothetical protein
MPIGEVLPPETIEKLLVLRSELAQSSVAQRFAARCAPPNENECILWTGATTEGYGLFIALPEILRIRAHRYAYEQAKGPIPEGLVIDHLCCVPSCVNPDHLEAVTIGENVRRSPLVRNPKGPRERLPQRVAS